MPRCGERIGGLRSAEAQGEGVADGGWISPLVLRGGRVVAVWELDREAGRIDVDAFEALPKTALVEEAAHLGRFLGRDLKVRIAR